MKYATIVLAALMMSTTSALTLHGNVTATPTFAQAKVNDTKAANKTGPAPLNGAVPPTLPNPAVPAQKEMQNGEIPVMTKHDPPTT
tara:strand:- start:239 stop:496 length:258 start_codon:yes stop_codon:yes gene_type:complete